MTPRLPIIEHKKECHTPISNKQFTDAWIKRLGELPSRYIDMQKAMQAYIDVIEDEHWNFRGRRRTKGFAFRTTASRCSGSCDCGLSNWASLSRRLRKPSTSTGTNARTSWLQDSAVHADDRGDPPQTKKWGLNSDFDKETDEDLLRAHEDAADPSKPKLVICAQDDMSSETPLTVETFWQSGNASLGSRVMVTSSSSLRPRPCITLAESVLFRSHNVCVAISDRIEHTR